MGAEWPLRGLQGPLFASPLEGALISGHCLPRSGDGAKNRGAGGQGVATLLLAVTTASKSVGAAGEAVGPAFRVVERF
jgi:hypothetical protein